MRRIPALALLAIFGSLGGLGGLEAQLTTPVGPPAVSGPGAAVHEIQPLFPSEFVARQIRAALADPRNQAHLTAVEEVLAARGSELREMATPPDVVDAPAEQTSTVVSGSQRGGATPETPGPEAARATLGQGGSTSQEASGSDASQGLTGVASWLGIRLSQSRVVALEAAQVVRGRLAALAGTVPASWVPWAILVLALAALILASALIRGRKPEDRSLKAARKLTRRGFGPAEVARRTGLSRDVIRVIEARRKPGEVA